MTQPADPRRIEAGVLAVLAGTPAAEIAAQLSIKTPALQAAVERYQAAGYAALERQTAGQAWEQTHITFDDWHTAEQTAVKHLRPELTQAETSGIVSTWFFTRKAPCWRLRCLPPNPISAEEVRTLLALKLGDMTAQGHITGWKETIYEPEAYAFGGSAGMDIAHDLFHQDSRCILSYLGQDKAAEPQVREIRRQELSMLLCSLLLRSAGQDWYEQGDVWARVAQHRTIKPGTPQERLDAMKPALKRLMTIDASPTSKLVQHGPPEPASDWTEAFEHAGQALGDLSRNGTLERGLRAVLAHHIIFHWNRLGLPHGMQGCLASTAKEVVLEP